MIPTIFDELRAEGFAEGYAESFAEGYAEALAEERVKTSQDIVLTVLRARFKKIPKKIKGSLMCISDVVTLKSLVAKAAICQTLDEFAAAVK
jgi:flagellar biosynthesis/type III secretory pathway protein FliH